MGALVALVCVVAGLALLGALKLAPLRRRQRDLLRKLSDEELAARVFRFEPRYFGYIGPGEPAVEEFRRLVQARDLRGIAAR